MIVKAHEGGPELLEGDPLHDPAPGYVLHCLGTQPKTVAIVACGPTSKDWHAAHFAYDPPLPPVDEVWTLNKGLRTQRADVGFVMDDLVGECRRSEIYRRDLLRLRVPIITSIVDDAVREYLPGANLVEYPLREVLREVGKRIAYARNPQRAAHYDDHARFLKLGIEAGYYLHNSVPFMLAYALYIGVKGVQLFGADYTFPGQEKREDDRANCEYWVGLLRAFGVQVTVPLTTTLLNTRKQPFLYGYGARPPVL